MFAQPRSHSLPWLKTGDIRDVTYALLLITGLAGSIVLHELGHALAGRLYGVRTSHMELNGLGGLCQDRRIAGRCARA